MAEPHRREQGFTLLELVTVMAVIAMLMGLGAGIFANLDFGARGTSGLLKSLLRNMREQAVRSGLPARCDIDAAAGRAEAVSFRGIGQWHFESPPAGGWSSSTSAPPPGATSLWGFDSGAGFGPSVTGGRMVPAGGAPGGYVALSAAGSVTLPIGGRYAFHTDRGFAVGVTIRVPAEVSGRLFSRKGSYDLSLDKDGSLSARVRLAEGDYGTSGRPRAAGDLLLRTAPGQVIANQWMRVQLLFDGRDARILLDGREVALSSTSIPMLLRVTEGADLSVGGGFGAPLDLDDLTLRTLTRTGPVELPDGLRLVDLSGDRKDVGQLSIYFTPEGALDPIHHRQPVTLTLAEARGGTRESRRRFRLGLLGVLQEEPVPLE